MEPSAYEFIFQSEKNHWWFVGRRLIVAKILEQLTKKQLFLDTLDIGSGFGAMIPLLLKYSKNVDCLEPWEEARTYLNQLGARTVYDTKNFPREVPGQQYSFVSMFDVLEHIKEEEEAIRVIYEELLTKNGKVMITVPANQWLWSKHDEVHHHFRRYSKKQLTELLRNRGFKNIQSSYFMTFLFPLAVFQRLRIKRANSKEEFQSLPSILNWFLRSIFSIESWFILFFPYPFGLSVIAIAEK